MVRVSMLRASIFRLLTSGLKLQVPHYPSRRPERSNQQEGHTVLSEVRG
jgi:hypothetical protein